jgi:Protein of unknown function (DUF1573)
MKRIFAALFLLGSAFNLLNAQSGPVMSFEKTEIDYGTIVQSSDGVRVFKFKNTGTESLIIKNARGSCGCTVPKWTSDPIKPGQTGQIEVKYETNRLGAYTKNIYVETNETNPNHTLVVKVNVIEKKFEANIIKSSEKGNTGNKR